MQACALAKVYGQCEHRGLAGVVLCGLGELAELALVRPPGQRGWFSSLQAGRRNVSRAAPVAQTSCCRGLISGKYFEGPRFHGDDSQIMVLYNTKPTVLGSVLASRAARI